MCEGERQVGFEVHAVEKACVHVEAWLNVGGRWVGYDMGEVPSGHVNGWLATSKRKARGFVVPVLGYMGHRPWVKIAIWA